MAHRAILGMVLLAVTACGGSDTNDATGGGSGGTGGVEPGCLQMPACTSTLRTARAICVEGECLEVGQRDESGAPIRSDMRIFSRYPEQVGAVEIRSQGITIFDPRTPQGGTLDCEQVLALEPAQRRNGGFTNVVAWSTIGVTGAGSNDTLTTPVSAIPVNDSGVEYLILSELFTGIRNTTTGENEGGLVAEGCESGLVVPPGRYLDNPKDERFSFLVQLRSR